MKFSALALATGLAFSASAFAAENVWDSTSPLDGLTVVDYAEWNVFGWSSISGNQFTDATPDVTGAGSLTVTGAPIITGTQNIYTFMGGPLAYSASLSVSTSGVFDVYLRAASMGLSASNTAYLNGVAATAIETYNLPMGEMFGEPSAQREYYFVWNNVNAASYTFTWNDPTAHVSLDQLALATVAVAAVPEPSSYAMLALGLGVLGAAARRRKQIK